MSLRDVLIVQHIGAIPVWVVANLALLPHTNAWTPGGELIVTHHPVTRWGSLQPIKSR